MQKQKKKSAPKKSRKLTQKEKRFCDLYLVSNNASDAARGAEYSAKTAKEQGCRLLTRVHVQDYLEVKRKELEEETKIDQKWVLERLVQVHERCMQTEPVRDKEGNETGEFVFKDSGANKSLELIGRHLGMFNDKLKIAGDAENPLKVEHVQIYIPDNGRDKK
jgi:phage terminase small subunit